MNDDFSVRRGLKNAPLMDQLASFRQRIGQVAIVRNRKTAELQVGEERLHVPHAGIARRGVARVADRRVAAQPVNNGMPAEDISHQTHVAVGWELLAIEADNSGRFLTTMLQGMQAQCGERGSFIVAEDAENCAFLLQFVIVKRVRGDHSGFCL